MSLHSLIRLTREVCAQALFLPLRILSPHTPRPPFTAEWRQWGQTLQPFIKTKNRHVCRYFSLGIVTTVVLQLLTIFYVGLMFRRLKDYQPYASSITQVGTSATLQRYRVKVSRCWAHVMSLRFLVQIGVFAKFQLVPRSDEPSSPSTIKLTSEPSPHSDRWNVSKWLSLHCFTRCTLVFQ